MVIGIGNILDVNCFYQSRLDHKYIFLLTHFDNKGNPVFYAFDNLTGILVGSMSPDYPVDSYNMINSNIEVGILNIPK